MKNFISTNEIINFGIFYLSLRALQRNIYQKYDKITSAHLRNFIDKSHSMKKHEPSKTQPLKTLENNNQQKILNFIE